MCIEYEVKEHLDLGQLAEDSEQLPALEMDLTGVARLEHLSLLRETQGNSEDVLNSELVEVGSTLDNLVQVAGAVAVGQPVLLVGEAGVGKTSLVRELARRTGKELLTLQVGHEVMPAKLTSFRILSGQRQHRLSSLGWSLPMHRAAWTVCLGTWSSHESSHQRGVASNRGCRTCSA